jgi:hypothetical protein
MLKTTLLKICQMMTSEASSEQFWKPLVMRSQTLTSKPQQVLIPEHNGQIASMPSEIKVLAVHAGRSLLQKPSQTESVFKVEEML